MTQQELLRIYSMYLPYKLKLKTKHGFDHLFTINADDFIINEAYEEPYELDKVKPYLIPLSDLTKEIYEDGGSFEFDYNLDKLNFKTVQNLLERHFDIFGLVEKGLAVNKNELS